jgi:hypothetical protein
MFGRVSGDEDLTRESRLSNQSMTLRAADIFQEGPDAEIDSVEAAN